MWQSDISRVAQRLEVSIIEMPLYRDDSEQMKWRLVQAVKEAGILEIHRWSQTSFKP